MTHPVKLPPVLPVEYAAMAAPNALAAAPRGCTHFKLRQIDRAVGRHYDAHMSVVGLKNTQYSLLSNVVRFGPIRPMDLAARLRMDASTLTRNLRPLIDQGWVVQGPGADARSRLVEVTEAGRVKRVAAQAAWKRAQLEINALLQPDRVARLHGLIDECLAALDAAAGAGDAESAPVGEAGSIPVESAA